MGWAAGNLIFDPVAEALLNEEASEDLTRLVLDALIAILLNGDWDTADESLERFRDSLVIRSVFYRHQVGTHLDGGDTTGRLGYDPINRQWTVECRQCGFPPERAEFTADGHDRLVHEWARHARMAHASGLQVVHHHLINPAAETAA